ALKLDMLASEVVLEDFDFTAKDGDDMARASIAVLANAASNVTMRRVKMTGGKGKKGGDGTTTMGTPMSTDVGNASSGATGGGTKTCMCTNGGQTTGGKGGNADAVNNGSMGSPGTPSLGGQAPTDGAGGASCTTGNFGAPGPKASGGAGAMSIGA